MTKILNTTTLTFLQETTSIFYTIAFGWISNLFGKFQCTNHISCAQVFFLCFRPIPDREFVEAYVKAYYLPAAQLEKWLREHKVG